MSFDVLLRLSFSALAAAGSSTRQAAAFLERLAAYPDPAVWIARTSVAQIDEQLEAAKARQAAGHDMPLLGVPFAVKDNIDVAGLPTTAACKAFARTPVADAPAVKRLRDAGAIVVGKTNLDQFATGLCGDRSPYGGCGNVFKPEYVSGGSSSGSAVAVAAGLVSFALGTDTAGSGRVPAGCNNIVGLKPTPGFLDTAGVVPACPSLDCVSIFALTVARRLADRVDRPRSDEGPDARRDADALRRASVGGPRVLRRPRPGGAVPPVARQARTDGAGEERDRLHAVPRDGEAPLRGAVDRGAVRESRIVPRLQSERHSSGHPHHSRDGGQVPGRRSIPRAGSTRRTSPPMPGGAEGGVAARRADDADDPEARRRRRRLARLEPADGDVHELRQPARPGGPGGAGRLHAGGAARRASRSSVPAAAIACSAASASPGRRARTCRSARPRRICPSRRSRPSRRGRRSPTAAFASPWPGRICRASRCIPTWSASGRSSCGPATRRRGTASWRSWT